MSLRDVFLFGILAILVPRMLKHPYIGVLAWVVFSVMSPHRLTWGVAYDFNFAAVIAIVTLVSLAFTKEHREIKGGSPGVVLIAFAVWCSFSCLFAFYPERAVPYWEQVMKVYFMTGVVMLVLHTRRHVELLIWAIVVSLGFYGVKGGIFTIRGGGTNMVMGPEGSMVSGNNALAVGLVVIIPLLVHLYQQYRHRWLRLGLAGAAVLCALSTLGSWSRGALLGILAMMCVLWARSVHKLPIFISAMLLVLVAIPAMPDAWIQRMQSIRASDEERDNSAKSRLVSWETAFNIAKDRFPIGGGFEWNGPETSAKYSPDPIDTHVAHSIYFQVMGSQGFIGLTILLLFWALVWQQCSWIRRKCRDRPDLLWAFSLASMTQASLVGYAVGGAFLDLAFLDLMYFLYAAIIITRYAVTQELALLAPVSSTGPTPRKAASGGARSYPAG